MGISKKEQGRIDMLKVICKDQNEITVAEVTEIFCSLFGSYFDKSKTGEAVKAKLTEEEFVRFVNGFSISFLSSLYCSASKDGEQLEIRMELIQKTNDDILIGIKVGKDNE